MLGKFQKAGIKQRVSSLIGVKGCPKSPPYGPRGGFYSFVR